MSKKTKKLSLKKETLRSLSAEQLAQVGGASDGCATYGGGTRPPPGTFGCQTNGCYQQNQYEYQYNYQYNYNYQYKG